MLRIAVTMATLPKGVKTMGNSVGSITIIRGGEPMKYFNIAADFKKETIDGYYRLNNIYKDSQVIETYGNITIGNTCEGGRVYEDLPKVDLKALQNYLEYSKAKGIDFNYSLNGSCMGNREFTEKGAADIRRFLYKLYDIGVRRLTIALPSIIELVKSTGLDFEIKVSIICQITNANKALQYKKLGAARLVVDESVNRDFVNLKKIREAFGAKTEIIINSMCHKDCIYRMFHYNQTAHDSVDKLHSSIITYYNHRCMLKRAEAPENFLKLCWVRPEDLHYYSEIGVNYYKIQGRHTVMKGDPVRALESYFRQSYEGDLIDLMELFAAPYAYKIKLDNKKLDGYLKPFLETPGFCKRDCQACRYCESFVQKCTDNRETQRINELAVQFYNEFDEYQTLLESLNDGSQTAQQAAVSREALNGEFTIDLDR
jgi:collagenase-like PrtC family protease